MLQEESDRFGDIMVLPMRDQYQDLSNKLLAIWRYGCKPSPGRCCVVCIVHAPHSRPPPHFLAYSGNVPDDTLWVVVCAAEAKSFVGAIGTMYGRSGCGWRDFFVFFLWLLYRLFYVQ